MVYRIIAPVISVCIILLDFVSKEWIRKNIPLGGSTEEFLHFRIINIQNTGSAFGLFQDQSPILTVIAFIGLVLMLIFYRRYSTVSLLASIGMGLILGGAMGNLIDRLRFGAVTDFIYFRFWDNLYWPAYNVADASVTVGIILFVCFIFFQFRGRDAGRPS